MSATRVTLVRRRIAARALRRSSLLEDAAVREQLKLLAELRRSILQGIGEAVAAGVPSYYLSRLLSLVDSEVERLRGAAGRLADTQVTSAFQAGVALVDDTLTTIEIRIVPVFSSALLDEVVKFTGEQLDAVWRELGARLKRLLRQGALGAQDPGVGIKNAAAAIRSPTSLRRALKDVETTIRAEMPRTFGLASQERLSRANDQISGMRKYWLSAEDSRVRPTHAAAQAAYEPGGRIGPIPVNQAYVVGGFRMMQPLDLRAPIKEIANCRCVSLPYIEGDIVRARAA